MTTSSAAATWAAFLVGAGEPEARARLTASLTQSRIGMSLAWHIRKISPGSTDCSSSTFPALSATRTDPAAGAIIAQAPLTSAAVAAGAGER